MTQLNRKVILISSTNRGANRNGFDFYATPIQAIEKLLTLEDFSNVKTILDPGAGSGNFSKVISKELGDISLDSVEIRPEEEENLKQTSTNVYISDFLDFETDKKYDLIIGNPPFNKAIEFVEKSLSMLNEGGRLIFLLRTAFLESKARYEFWQKNPLSRLLVFSKRPSFTDSGKSDSTSYSWFIWDKATEVQKIKVI